VLVGSRNHQWQQQRDQIRHALKQAVEPVIRFQISPSGTTEPSKHSANSTPALLQAASVLSRIHKRAKAPAADSPCQPSTALGGHEPSPTRHSLTPCPPNAAGTPNRSRWMRAYGQGLMEQPLLGGTPSQRKTQLQRTFFEGMVAAGGGDAALGEQGLPGGGDGLFLGAV
jgi:hypothetical protein